MSVRIAVFASGGGTNLQALLDHFNSTVDRGARIKLVISDRAGAAALRRAADAGVMTHVIAVSRIAEDEVAPEMLRVLDEEKIDLIALAGYLRLVPAAVITRYRDHIVNIHPALLPSFGGAGMYGRRVHDAVLAGGCMVTGPTVHYVDESYDEGSIIAQWPVPVLPGDTAAALAARVLAVEHVLYPLALEAVVRRMTRDAIGTGADADVDANANAAANAAVHELSFMLKPSDPNVSTQLKELLHP